MARHLLATISTMEPGTLRRIDVDGQGICLARLGDGSFHAISDVCSHEGASLSAGEIWGHTVECPLHSSQFDVRTGSVTGMPAELPVAVYRLEVEGDSVVLDIP
jgi:nitrite reductase/ring-hydroxylating ferredoxin subunit